MHLMYTPHFSGQVCPHLSFGNQLLSVKGGYSSRRPKRYAARRTRQRTTPITNSCIWGGYVPVNKTTICPASAAKSRDDFSGAGIVTWTEFCSGLIHNTIARFTPREVPATRTPPSRNTRVSY